MRSGSRVAALARALGRLILTTLFGASAVAQTPGDSQRIEIGGFQIDTSRDSKSTAEETLATLRHQIGIVESANLPPAVLEFFRGIPISVDPSLTRMNGEYAQESGRWLIHAKPGKWPEDRAILLHELLHAYHHQVLKQPTPRIGRALAEARREGVYPKKYREAYFLTNPREYFAVIAEIYLSGPSFRPPFECGNVLKAQPQFVAYLAELFGERECK